MGISHPLSDEFDSLRAAVLTPDRSPPSSPPPPPPSSCCSADEDYLEHQVSMMDTLAGLAIKYGISDIKRANSLMTDSQMFAHKILLIPLPGKPMPSSVRLNGSGQRMKRTWVPNYQQNRDVMDSLDSSKYNSSERQMSLAMSTLQTYYGLTPQKGGTTDAGTEMSLYSKGSLERISSETSVNSSGLPDTYNTGRSRNSEDTLNGFSATNGSTGTKSNVTNNAKQDGSVRRRQKVEADRVSNTTDTQQDDILSDPIKMIKSLFPRPISSIRLNMDTSNPEPRLKSSGSFLSGFKYVRKSPSTTNFVDEENGISMWSSSFTRPLLDGLPKPTAHTRTKAALD
uniref:LysM domain-containing protein n=1 Tax=Leersia perrieri TaxID=77586 RepID=A0A0D9WUE5_9ORYZ